MPCYHPLTRVSSGTLNLETGKTIGTVKSYVPQHLRLPNAIYQDIPCGQCIGCRIDYSRKWADRLVMESKLHKYSWFVTLTYDDEHLPIADPIDFSGYPTLVKRHVQLFMKRLRKLVSPEKIRFYCAGEYGTKTFRPHYHLIIFGLTLNDLKFYKLNDLKQPYYNSALLSDAWQNQGFVVVAPASYETMLYTARYVTKKLKGFESSFYKNAGIEPPFSLMSRKPGIAGDYYSYEIMLDDKIVLPQGRLAPHPRYFQKLLEKEYPDFYDVYKEERKARNDIRMQNLLDKIEVPYLDYLKTLKESFINRTKILDKTRNI